MKIKGLVIGAIILLFMGNCGIITASSTQMDSFNQPVLQDTIPCRSLWEDIHEEMEEAFNEIDWEKIRREMDQARADALSEIRNDLEAIEWEVIRKELQEEMKDLKVVIDSLYREIEKEFREDEEE